MVTTKWQPQFGNYLKCMIVPWRKNFDVEHVLTFTNFKHLNIWKCWNVTNVSKVLKVLYVPIKHVKLFDSAKVTDAEERIDKFLQNQVIFYFLKFFRGISTSCIIPHSLGSSLGCPTLGNVLWSVNLSNFVLCLSQTDVKLSHIGQNDQPTEQGLLNTYPVIV